VPNEALLLRIKQETEKSKAILEKQALREQKREDYTNSAAVE